MKIETVLFDLDGTLTDSGPGIMNSIRYALTKSGIAVPGEDVLRTFIGPPLKEQFELVFGLSDREGAEMVEKYREYYSVKGIYENTVYDGVPEMLEMLREAGLRILMATSKPEKFARMIADHFDFAKYFDYIGGACMDGRRTDKYEVIEYVLESGGFPEQSSVRTADGTANERETAVMVGDRSHDIIGAGKAGLHSLGVLYGYGSEDELKGAGAEKLASSPKEAAERILTCEWQRHSE